MISTQKIYDLLSKECIQLGHFQLPDGRLGYYRNDQDAIVIIIDPKVKKEIDMRCTIAHEIGHHFTTIGNYSNKDNEDLRNSITENNANRWAINYLIRTKDLLKVLSVDSSLTLKELADIFDVSDSFIISKIKIMSEQIDHWHINDDDALYVSNVPEVYMSKVLDPDRLDEVKAKTKAFLIAEEDYYSKQIG